MPRFENSTKESFYPDQSKTFYFSSLADEWVSEAEFCPTRSVKISVLPETSKTLIGEQLLPRQDRRKQGRKTKRVARNTDFFTPDELDAIKEEEEKE